MAEINVHQYFQTYVFYFLFLKNIDIDVYFASLNAQLIFEHNNSISRASCSRDFQTVNRIDRWQKMTFTFQFFIYKLYIWDTICPRYIIYVSGRVCISQIQIFKPSIIWMIVGRKKMLSHSFNLEFQAFDRKMIVSRNEISLFR